MAGMYIRLYSTQFNIKLTETTVFAFNNKLVRKH